MTVEECVKEIIAYNNEIFERTREIESLCELLETRKINELREKKQQERVRKIIDENRGEAKFRMERGQSISELCNLPYEEYLLTEHWQEVRRGALKRAKHKCQLCNKSSNLHVHHRTYENRGCEDISDVIVLCRECHEKHHDIHKGTLEGRHYLDIDRLGEELDNVLFPNKRFKNEQTV